MAQLDFRVRGGLWHPEGIDTAHVHLPIIALVVAYQKRIQLVYINSPAGSLLKFCQVPSARTAYVNVEVVHCDLGLQSGSFAIPREVRFWGPDRFRPMAHMTTTDHVTIAFAVCVLCRVLS